MWLSGNRTTDPRSQAPIYKWAHQPSQTPLGVRGRRPPSIKKITVGCALSSGRGLDGVRLRRCS